MGNQMGRGVFVWRAAALLAIGMVLSTLAGGAARASTLFIGTISNDPNTPNTPIPVQVQAGSPAHIEITWNALDPYPYPPCCSYPALPPSTMSIDWGDGTTTDFVVTVGTATEYFDHTYATALGLVTLTATWKKYWWDAANPFGAPLLETVSAPPNAFNVLAAAPIPPASVLFGTALAGLAAMAGARRRRPALLPA